ncbi:hypothetical protein ACLOJK_033992 [Asimina triloba]
MTAIFFSVHEPKTTLHVATKTTSSSISHCRQQNPVIVMADIFLTFKCQQQNPTLAPTNSIAGKNPSKNGFLHCNNIAAMLVGENPITAQRRHELTKSGMIHLQKPARSASAAIDEKAITAAIDLHKPGIEADEPISTAVARCHRPVSPARSPSMAVPMTSARPSAMPICHGRSQEVCSCGCMWCASRRFKKIFSRGSWVASGCGSVLRTRRPSTPMSMYRVAWLPFRICTNTRALPFVSLCILLALSNSA